LRRTVLEGRQLRLVIDDGRGELRLGDAARAGEVSAAQGSICKYALAEVGPVEAHIFEIGSGEVDISELRLAQVRLPQVNTAQNNAAYEYFSMSAFRTFQIHSAQIGPRAFRSV